MQGIVFVEITFEKYTTNFYFENGEVGIKTKTAKCVALLTLHVLSFLVFNKKAFHKLATSFLFYVFFHGCFSCKI